MSKKLTPVQVPLIFLIDNTNIYHGNKKYHRLFHVFGPKMWNFPGRGILIPSISGLENILSCRETSCESQGDILEMTYEDILISQHPEHQKLWDDSLNMYLLQGLSDAFNKLPRNVDKLSESELNSWLSKQNMDELLTRSNVPHQMN